MRRKPKRRQAASLTGCDSKRGDDASTTQLPTELEAMARLIADGALALPMEPPPSLSDPLVRRVRALRHHRLLRLIADVIARDLSAKK